MKTALTIAWLSAVVLALSGCGSKDEPEPQGEVGGEILSGSVSDAMIPYDSLRSHPPLAPRIVASGSGKGSNAADEAGDPEETDDGASAPTAGSTAPASGSEPVPAVQ